MKCQKCKSENITGVAWLITIDTNTLVLQYICNECEYESEVFVNNFKIEYPRIVKNNPKQFPAFILDEDHPMNWPHLRSSKESVKK